MHSLLIHAETGKCLAILRCFFFLFEYCLTLQCTQNDFNETNILKQNLKIFVDIIALLGTWQKRELHPPILKTLYGSFRWCELTVWTYCYPVWWGNVHIYITSSKYLQQRKLILTFCFLAWYQSLCCVISPVLKKVNFRLCHSKYFEICSHGRMF